MANESTQHKLDRVRSPRVHVTYDVEIGDAMEQKELPFVLGVLGDFTGQSDPDAPKLRDRKFVEVTPDNFDAVLAGMKPRVSFSVANRLDEKVETDIKESAIDDPNAPQLKVDLEFKSLQDFEPDRIAQQVKPLRELLELRQKLADLQSSIQGNDALDSLLESAIKNTEQARQLQQELAARKESEK
jgi:type VI secretion system protein ImpB